MAHAIIYSNITGGGGGGPLQLIKNLIAQLSETQRRRQCGVYTGVTVHSLSVNHLTSKFEKLLHHGHRPLFVQRHEEGGFFFLADRRKELG